MAGPAGIAYSPKITYGPIPHAGPVAGDRWICPIQALGYATQGTGGVSDENQVGRFAEFIYLPEQAAQLATDALVNNWASASPNFPWVCISGTEWIVNNTQSGTFTGSGVDSFGNALSAGTNEVKFFANIAGEYDARCLVTAQCALNGTFLECGISRGTDGPGTSDTALESYGSSQVNITVGAETRSVALTVGQDLRIRYCAANTIVHTFRNRWLKVRPVRVAHMGG